MTYFSKYVSVTWKSGPWTYYDEDIVGANTQYEANLADDERTPTGRHPDYFFVDDDEHISSAGADSVGDVPATSSRRCCYSPVRDASQQACLCHFDDDVVPVNSESDQLYSTAESDAFCML
jgi:hypothetical protein